MSPTAHSPRASSPEDRASATTFDSADLPHRHPRSTPEARSTNQALVDLLGRIAARKHATPAQVALAWRLSPRSPGSCRSPAPAGSNACGKNLAAADVELTADDLHEIEDAASQITVHRAGIPNTFERMTGR